MNTTESLRIYGLIPADESLPAIRVLLATEAEAERTGKLREKDLALLCCVQLFSRGLPEDVLRIWEAKRSGMDLGCYLDVQFLCGSGLESTRAFLAVEASPTATAALRYIKECEATGDFVGFSPANHLAQYRRYFAINWQCRG